MSTKLRSFKFDPSELSGEAVFVINKLVYGMDISTLELEVLMRMEIYCREASGKKNGWAAKFGHDRLKYALAFARDRMEGATSVVRHDGPTKATEVANG